MLSLLFFLQRLLLFVIYMINDLYLMNNVTRYYPSLIFECLILILMQRKWYTTFPYFISYITPELVVGMGTVVVS